LMTRALRTGGFLDGCVRGVQGFDLLLSECF
jgi:hypothetical protein